VCEGGGGGEIYVAFSYANLTDINYHLHQQFCSHVTYPVLRTNLMLNSVVIYVDCCKRLFETRN